MKRNRFFGGVLLILLVTATSPVIASITGWNCADDNDGAIVMSPGSWTDYGGGEYGLSMSCKQYGLPGHIAGDFTTNNEQEPTVGFLEDVQNDTDFAWADYHIDFGMTKSFTILNATVPSGWTAIITQPVADQPLPANISPGLGWVGEVDYYQGTGDPIAINDDGTFGLKVSFTGSVSFYTADTPTPEPATIMLLGLGALALLRRRR